MFLLTVSGTAQERVYYEERLDEALYGNRYSEAMSWNDSLISISDGAKETADHLNTRAYIRSKMNDCEGALIDLDSALVLTGDTCFWHETRAYCMKRCGHRSAACGEMDLAIGCGGTSERLWWHQTFCDPNWDYDGVNHFYLGDSTNVDHGIQISYYKDCQQMEADTSYYLRPGLSERESHWVIYWDPGMQLKYSEGFYEDDTLHSRIYYRTGELMADDLSVDMNWVHTASWCENGFQTFSSVIQDSTPAVLTSYHCNGIISGQKLHFNHMVWDTVRTWYSNGVKELEYYYTPLTEELREQRSFDSEFQGSAGWDSLGVPLEVPPTPNDWEVLHLDFMKVYARARKEVDGKPMEFDVSNGYQDQMMNLIDIIHRTAKRQKGCKCKVGVVRIKLGIDATGRIYDPVVMESLDPVADQMFLDAIKKIGTWTPAMLWESPVDAEIEIVLQLEAVR